MASVQVFGSPASAEVARVLTCLFEKEVEFQLIRTDTNHQANLSLGRGRLERASIEQWLRTESQIFDPPSSTLVFYLAFAPLQGIERDEEEVQKSKKELEKVLDIYDKRLNEMSFLAGDKFTLADLAHLPNTHRLMTMVPECASMFEERPNVMKWWEAISGRPKWTRVVDLQKEAPAVA